MKSSAFPTWEGLRIRRMSTYRHLVLLVASNTCCCISRLVCVGNLLTKSSNQSRLTAQSASDCIGSIWGQNGTLGAGTGVVLCSALASTATNLGCSARKQTGTEGNARLEMVALWSPSSQESRTKLEIESIYRSGKV